MKPRQSVASAARFGQPSEQANERDSPRCDFAVQPPPRRHALPRHETPPRPQPTTPRRHVSPKRLRTVLDSSTRLRRTPSRSAARHPGAAMGLGPPHRCPRAPVRRAPGHDADGTASMRHRAHALPDGRRRRRARPRPRVRRARLRGAPRRAFAEAVPRQHRCDAIRLSTTRSRARIRRAVRVSKAQRRSARRRAPRDRASHTTSPREARPRPHVRRARLPLHRLNSSSCATPPLRRSSPRRARAPKLS